jgi:hypothetical protein
MATPNSTPIYTNLTDATPLAHAKLFGNCRCCTLPVGRSRTSWFSTEPRKSAGSWGARSYLRLILNLFIARTARFQYLFLCLCGRIPEVVRYQNFSIPMHNVGHD